MQSASPTRTAASLRALLEGLIDYAGLFPPAALDMPTAVANYAKYLAGEHRWALGRFIVPAARLEEFRGAQQAAIDPERQDGTLPWQISAIVGVDVQSELKLIAQFNTKSSAKAVVDVVEAKASTVDDVRRNVPLIPKEITAYLEIAANSEPEMFRVLAASGVRAKIRTGGVVESAFPSVEQVAEFIIGCTEARVPFKATAGLHHPLRCAKPLTYASDAPRGTMHGFLNVFMAASACTELREQESGRTRESLKNALVAILMNEDPERFIFGEEKAILRGLSNRDLEIPTEVVRDTRRNVAIAFGSCSFEEPIEDLRGFHLL